MASNEAQIAERPAYSPDLPAPKFRIGQTVFYATSVDTSETVECPDCKGTGKWKVVTPAGPEYETSCQRCSTSFSSHPTIRIPSASPVVETRTIGSVRIDTADTRSAVSYMANETGIGGGAVYREVDLFDNEESAQLAAKFKAGEMVERLQANPRVQATKELRYLTIHDAEIRAAEERASDLRYDLDYLKNKLWEEIGYRFWDKVKEEEVRDYLKAVLGEDEYARLEEAFA